MKKKTKIIIGVAACFVCLGILWVCMKDVPVLRNLEKQAGFRLPPHLTMEYTDSHGGFFGDGETFLVLTFGEKEGESLSACLEDAADWNPLPLSGNLDGLLFGGAGGDRAFQGIGETVKIPDVQSGFWYFLDRYQESETSSGDPHSDDDLLSRYSYNFTVMIYDAESRTLYYYELDT